MNASHAFETAKRMSEDLLDYGPARSRLPAQTMRALAHGQPVTEAQVDRMAAEANMARDEADRFLRQITERDTEDRIVGIMGLSLNKHPHRFSVNGVALTAWCAEDTLFLPALLNQTAEVESHSPASNRIVRLTVRPERVVTVNPPDAVLSFVVVDPSAETMASVTNIWTTFCRQIHFFASREEAEQWAAGRNDIAIARVNEGFALGQQIWSKVLPYAA